MKGATDNNASDQSLRQNGADWARQVRRLNRATDSLVHSLRRVLDCVLCLVDSIVNFFTGLLSRAFFRARNRCETNGHQRHSQDHVANNFHALDYDRMSGASRSLLRRRLCSSCQSGGPRHVASSCCHSDHPGAIDLGAQSDRNTIGAPRFWNDRELADWATPVAGLNVRSGHFLGAPVLCGADRRVGSDSPGLSQGRSHLAIGRCCTR